MYTWYFDSIRKCIYLNEIIFVNRPEHVATAIIQLIEHGKNGAIYVIENNQPAYAIEIPSYSALKVPI